MKCIYCGYEEGWNEETMNFVEGKEGHFFMGDFVSRNDIKNRETLKYLVGCPECNKIFMSGSSI